MKTVQALLSVTLLATAFLWLLIFLCENAPALLRQSRTHAKRPACNRNESAVNVKDFASLRGDVKEFLYYRHCRSFPLLLDLPEKCGGPEASGGVYLLLVIKSAPENYDRREALRKTWARERSRGDALIRRVFVLGKAHSSEAEELNELMELEHAEHRDVLQWDFDDSFYNLTLKQTLFMAWLDKNCPDVRFLVNGDDDVFVNTDNVVDYLRGLPDPDGTTHLFTGHLIVNAGPIRNPSDKYYVPVQVQESAAYPAYCGGGTLILSGYTARVISDKSRLIDIHPIDDVYMGMCLAAAGLAPSSHTAVIMSGAKLPLPPGLHPCYYRDFLAVHGFLSFNMYLMWHKVRDRELKCGRLNERR